MNKRRWRAEDKSVYWVLDSTGRIVQLHDTRLPVDNALYDFGNYFKTKKDAEVARKKIKKLLLEG